MKKIFSLIGLCFVMNSYAQSVFKPAVSGTQGPSAEFELVAKSRFINKFESKMLVWERITNNLSSGWTAAFCDCQLCHGVSTDSSSFMIDIGDSCETSAHFYPKNIKGNGTMKIKVYAKGNTLDFIIGEFNATSWGASAKFIKNEQLVVSPNPSHSVLNIDFGSGEPYTLSVMASDGKLIFTENMQSISSSTDVSGYVQGTYTVRIESQGKLYYAKFVKI